MRLWSMLTLHVLAILPPQIWLLLPLSHFPQGSRRQMSGEGSSVDAVKWGDCCHPGDLARRKWRFNRCLITCPAGPRAVLSGQGRAWVRAGLGYPVTLLIRATWAPPQGGDQAPSLL